MCKRFGHTFGRCERGSLQGSTDGLQPHASLLLVTLHWIPTTVCRVWDTGLKNGLLLAGAARSLNCAHGRRPDSRAAAALAPHKPRLGGGRALIHTRLRTCGHPPDPQLTLQALAGSPPTYGFPRVLRGAIGRCGAARAPPEHGTHRLVALGALGGARACGPTTTHLPADPRSPPALHALRCVGGAASPL